MPIIAEILSDRDYAKLDAWRREEKKKEVKNDRVRTDDIHG